MRTFSTPSDRSGTILGLVFPVLAPSEKFCRGSGLAKVPMQRPPAPPRDSSIAARELTPARRQSTEDR